MGSLRFVKIVSLQRRAGTPVPRKRTLPKPAVHTKDTEVKDHLANSILKDRINLGLYECSLFAEMAGFQGLFNRVFGTHECFVCLSARKLHDFESRSSEGAKDMISYILRPIAGG